MKRDKQGHWKDRYVCFVPHTFLYYYDSEDTMTPRGIIDMELYTNITREGTVLKIASPLAEKHPNLREYLFESDDLEYLDEWLSSLNRDRYAVVCEERDAYRMSQLELTSVIDAAAVAQSEQIRERFELEKELQQSKTQITEACLIMQGVLLILGITEDEMADISNKFKKMGGVLQRGILQLKTDIDAIRTESIATSASERDMHARSTEEKDKLIKVEQEARLVLYGFMLCS